MSNLPQIQPEDKPPMLRFAQLAVEDKVLSEETGQTEYKDIVKVFVRAAGDTKCEVPFLAKDKQYTTKTVVMDVASEIKRRVRNKETGALEEMMEPVTERREDVIREAVTVYPWLDQLRDKLKSGFVTQDYYDYCKRAFERFMANETAPVEGIPLSEWRGATESMKMRAMQIGINSVEKAAEMTDEAIEAIGFGGRDLKQRAIKFLEANASPNKAAQKMVDLEAENKALKGQMEDMMREMRAFMAEKNDIKVSSDKPDELQALRDEVEKATGQKPHHKMGEDKLRQILAEAQAAA